ncbi:tol-pal system protein YbgF [Paenalcaligenes suwonensis]|uniref:tol-pal system protein YbgF n=1 Tax=Paenalcaligenes suwonensis TaxID=1202713 RepID=UPI00140A03C4|nr:tol-pal system protein YbgF [Paenalcaligenes suwonensis]NHC60582.1 tol-pal system protein YbgF [Paenalcaligenes suwonensis]
MKNLPLRRLLLPSFASLFLFTAMPAEAFADDEARRAILELRQQVRQMNEQNQQARLRLADEVEMLRQEVATLRGKVEQLSWQNSQGQEGDTNQTLFDDPQEQAAYEGAMDLYRSGQYPQAASGFSAFIDAYPNSPQLDEVRFYEGSALYASRNFRGAIQKLQALVKDRPGSPRAADALMVIASSEVEQNDLAGAQKTLQRIVKDYPGTAAADTAKNRLELLR